MGFINTITGRITATLSPTQYTRQQSKPGTLGTSEVWEGIHYNKEGHTYQDYNDMLTDPQIKSGYELLRIMLLSRKLIINPSDDTPEAKDLADEIEDTFKHMDYPMRKVRNDMYSAIVYGFSVSEKIMDYNESNQRLTLKRLRPIPISTLDDCFEYDDYGNLQTIIQNNTSGTLVKLKPEKCLVYTYDEQFGDREGNSILDAVYDDWYIKQKLMSWWNVYLQKHEGPTLAAFLENPQYKDDVRDMLEDVQEGRTNMTFGQNDKLQIVESSHRGEGFKEAINYHDVMIYRKMNIGTMILGQENGSGAYAQSKTQYDTLSIFLDGIHEDIAAELQILVNELVSLNYGENVIAPRVSFETFEEKDLLTLLEKLNNMISSFAVNPEDKWFRQLLADVVSRYSDVDTSELLKEHPVDNGVVNPSLTDQSNQLPPEHQELIQNVTDLYPTPKTVPNQ